MGGIVFQSTLGGKKDEIHGEIQDCLEDVTMGRTNFVVGDE